MAKERVRAERIFTWVVICLAVGFVAGHVVTMIAVLEPVGVGR